MKLIKHVIVFFALSLPLAAQQQSVYQQLFTNQTAIGVSPVVRNIGQAYHHIDVFGSNACGSSGSGTGSITLEGSNDSVSFVQFAPPVILLLPYNYPGSSFVWHASTSAAGSYAYIRANYTQLFNSTSSCRVNVFYSGNVNSPAIGSQPFTVASDTFQYLNTIITTSGGQVTTSCPVNTAVQIYGLVLNSSTAQTVQLNMDYIDQSGTNISNLYSFAFSLPANGSAVLPPGSRPYFTSTLPLIETSPIFGTNTTFLQILSTAAGNVSVAETYRCE